MATEASKVFIQEELNLIRRTKSDLWEIMHTSQVFIKGGLLNKPGTPEYLPPRVQSQCVITGGIIPSLISSEHWNDIDLFILGTDKAHIFRFLTDNDPDWEFGSPGYSQASHIINVARHPKTRVNIIHSTFDTRKDLLMTFDYKHCTACYIPGESDTLFITRETFDCIRKKELCKVNKNIPDDNARVAKFIARGYRYPSIFEHKSGRSLDLEGLDQQLAELFKD